MWVLMRKGCILTLVPNTPYPLPILRAKVGVKNRKESFDADESSKTDSDDESSDDEVEDIDDMIKDRKPEHMPDVDYDKRTLLC